MPRFCRLVCVAFAVLLLRGPAGLAGEEKNNDLKTEARADKPPKPLKRPPPVYPEEMARAGLIGTVKVTFIIDKEGKVRNPYVTESNNPWFERPAVNAVLGWKFEPGEKQGRPVNTLATQVIMFELGPGGTPLELWRVTKGKEHSKLPPEFQWDKPPTPVNTMFPVYPYEQLQANVTGKAVANYVVGPDGRVVGAMVREATTPEFGQAVLAMIDAWRFTPAKKKDGTPAYANLSIEYNFRTNGRGDVPVTEEARGILRDLERRPKTIATLKDLDQPLKPRSTRPPVYPTALEKSRQSGTVQIEFYVDEEGDAQLPRIVSCSAPEFGYAAVQAVATWRFEAPVRNKRATVVRVQVPVEFKLSPEKDDKPGP